MRLVITAVFVDRGSPFLYQESWFTGQRFQIRGRALGEPQINDCSLLVAGK